MIIKQAGTVSTKIFPFDLEDGGRPQDRTVAQLPWTASGPASGWTSADRKPCGCCWSIANTLIRVFMHKAGIEV